MKAKIAITGLALLGVTFASAGSAEAASASLGAYSCSQGSLFTRATANYDVTHTVFKGGVRYNMVFTSSAPKERSTTYYTGIYVMDSGTISNGGTISYAIRNCDA